MDLFGRQNDPVPISLSDLSPLGPWLDEALEALDQSSNSSIGPMPLRTMTWLLEISFGSSFSNSSIGLMPLRTIEWKL